MQVHSKVQARRAAVQIPRWQPLRLVEAQTLQALRHSEQLRPEGRQQQEGVRQQEQLRAGEL